MALKDGGDMISGRDLSDKVGRVERTLTKVVFPVPPSPTIHVDDNREEVQVERQDRSKTRANGVNW